MSSNLRKFDLVDTKDNDVPILQIEIAFGEAFADAKIFEPYSWVEDKKTKKYNKVSERQFVASVTYKWDCCSHWNFYGEDYPNENPNDSYYHLCGVSSQTNFQRAVSFMRQVFKRYYEGHIIEDEFNDYSEKVDNLLLEDCEIIERT